MRNNTLFSTIKRIAKAYWWLLLLLIVAGYYAFFVSQNSTYRRYSSEFGVSDTSTVTRILLSNSDGNIELLRTDTGWFCNGTQRVKQEAIHSVMMALAGLRALAPVPLSVSDSLRGVMDRASHRVQVYSGRRQLRNILLHRTETLHLQTIGRLNRSSELFLLEIPPFGSDVLPYFSTQVDFWSETRSRLAVQGQTLAVEVEVPSEPEMSFRIDLQNPSQPELHALYYGIRVNRYNPDRLNKYLQALFSVVLDPKSAILSKEQTGEVNLTQPDFIFNIYSHDGPMRSYRFIPIMVEEYMDEFGRPVHFDLNRMYLTTNMDNSIYEVRFLPLAGIMKEITYFEPRLSE